MRDLLKRFWNDERGIAFVFFLVAMPAFIGVSLLAIDIGRGNNLHYDVQKGVDALALAAAAELDGLDDALDRANAALDGVIANRSRFSDNGNITLSRDNIEVHYLHSIPNHDDQTIDLSVHRTSDPVEAAFAWVRVTDDNAHPYRTIFPVSLARGRETVDIGAEAVAGYHVTVCDLNPMFICNPFGNLDDLRDSLTESTKPQILMKQQGGNTAQWGPGNFGFLQTPEGSQNPHVIGEYFANKNPPLCYSGRSVETKPGTVPPVNQYINVRFDLYQQHTNNMRNEEIYAPAPHVVKGLVRPGGGQGGGQGGGNMCSYQAPDEDEQEEYRKLTRDHCLTSNTCESITGHERLGDGEWDFESYWEINHPEDDPLLTGLMDNGTPSRYDVYRYELEQMEQLSWGPEGEDLYGTDGDQQNFCAPEPATDPDRRVIYAAIVPCPIDGGQQTLVPEAFGKFFLTEPAGAPPETEIYAELIDIVGGLGTMEGMVREDVVLYR